jgi:peroxiredoxin Q/BCP
MNSGKVENFILKDQDGNKFELYANLGKNILLIFYPKDNSPVCSKQLRNYQLNIKKFNDADILPVAINIESAESHKSFCELKGIDFPILSDTDKSISKKFGALNLFSLNKRKLVLINKQGEIAYETNIFALSYLKTDEILSDLHSLNLI